MEPTTLLSAVRYFADLNECNQYMSKVKWPKGKVTCPACGSNRIGEIATRHMLRCKECRKQFSYKVGTIFEDSPLGLDKWFVMVEASKVSGRTIGFASEVYDFAVAALGTNPRHTSEEIDRLVELVKRT